MVNPPVGLEFVNSSIIIWKRLSSGSQLNKVQIKVSNKLATKFLSFSIFIEPAYVVELADIAPRNIFVSSPIYILVNCTLKMAQNTSQVQRGTLPVNLRLTKYIFNEMSITKSVVDIRLVTLLNGRLTYVFYPNRNEYGDFTLEAIHPFLRSNNSYIVPSYSRFNFTVLGNIKYCLI